MKATNDLWSGKNPWLGLRTYNEGRKLYGRDNEISSLTDIIRNNVAVVLFGKSGVGKSSLLKAGVSPELRQKNMFPVHIRFEHNGSENYIEQIEKKVACELIVKDRLPEQTEVQSLWEFFHRNDFYDSQGNEVMPVVILDQFEEIYTLTDKKYKQEVQRFFTELADLLNDVVPDSVMERSCDDDSHETDNDGGNKEFSITIHRDLRELYKNEMDFRFVICLREDYLYLLELNSRKIPALKVNRYRLHAFDVDAAREVIMSPRPGLIDSEKANDIIQNISVVNEDGEMAIEPNILSIFLFKYFNKHGDATPENIIEEYYADETKVISKKALSYLEKKLITGEGYRHHIPYNDAINAGVSEKELELLFASRILTKEPHKGHYHIEFSHDVLCPIAKKHRDERLIREAKRKLTMRLTLVVVFVVLFAALGIIWSKSEKNEQELEEKKKGPALILVGGGSAANLIANTFPECNPGKYLDGYYIHMPTRTAWVVIAEEFITPTEGEEKRHYPVCMSADSATEKDFTKSISPTEMAKIGAAIQLQIGWDTLAVYAKKGVFNKNSVRITGQKRYISSKQLLPFVRDRKDSLLNVLTTSWDSGTRHAYETQFANLGYDFSCDTTEKFSEYSDYSLLTDGNTKPYLLLGSENFYSKVLDVAQYRNDWEKYVVTDTSGKTALRKPVYLYFMGYCNDEDKTILTIPEQVLNYLKHFPAFQNSKKVKDGKVIRNSEESVLIDITGVKPRVSS